jgi:large subunit ribosomal protein L4
MAEKKKADAAKAKSKGEVRKKKKDPIADADTADVGTQAKDFAKSAVDVFNTSNEKVSNIVLHPDVFRARVNKHLLYEAVKQYRAGARAGTHATKNRALVSGSGKKPWRQKGTGRARAGMTSSPLWRGGGKIFPNSPDENFSQKVNRKMYRAGMASILSQLAREDRIRVVEEFKIDAPKTKMLAQKVKAMGFDEVLVLTDEVDQNLALSSRNLENVQVMSVRNANPVALVRSARVLLTRNAVAKLEELLK